MGVLISLFLSHTSSALGLLLPLYSTITHGLVCILYGDLGSNPGWPRAKQATYQCSINLTYSSYSYKTKELNVLISHIIGKER